MNREKKQRPERSGWTAGVPLPTVSKRLGHASTLITAQIYAHAFTKDEQAAADIWDTTTRKAVEGEKARQ
jgi:integrase